MELFLFQIGISPHHFRAARQIRAVAEDINRSSQGLNRQYFPLRQPESEHGHILPYRNYFQSAIIAIMQNANPGEVGLVVAFGRHSCSGSDGLRATPTDTRESLFARDINAASRQTQSATGHRPFCEWSALHRPSGSRSTLNAACSGMPAGVSAPHPPAFLRLPAIREVDIRGSAPSSSADKLGPAQRKSGQDKLAARFRLPATDTESGRGISQN